jgi:PAS domain S-box-containing protein
MENWWTILVSVAGVLILTTGLIAAFVLLRTVRLRARHERAQLVAESERKYSSLFNTVSDCMYVHTADGTVLDVNESAARVLSSSVGDVVGRQISEVIGRRYAAQVAAYLQRISEEKREIQGLFHVAPIGTSRAFIFEYRSTPVIENGVVSRVQGIARNVTDQKNYERSLRRSDTQMKLLLERSRVMRENLEIVSREMLKVQEEERRRISRELHDEIGQLLATMTVNLELMKKSFSLAQDPMLKIRIGETENLAREMFGRIKQFLHELRPVALDELGLLPAIRRLLRDVSDRTGIEMVMAGEPDAVNEFSDEKKAVVFRLIQESLTNIVKYANATRVTLDIHRNSSYVAIRIADDGQGFNVSTLRAPYQPHHGLGILGMQERVKLVQGEFNLTSELGAGTSIQVMIPLDREPAAPIVES